MNQHDIIEFYLDLVRRAQERGIRCAITSGMACVAFEVAESTKDCDLLCDHEMADKFIALLTESPLGNAPCQYRGNISPPLDARMIATPQPLTAVQQERIREFREDHLRRAFGDEIARVSKLPLMERYRYVAWMIYNGRKHGVKHTREPRGVTE